MARKGKEPERPRKSAPKKTKGRKEHRCHICGQIFGRPAEVMRHIFRSNAHGAIPEQPCPWRGCEFITHQPGNVKVHIKGPHERKWPTREQEKTEEEKLQLIARKKRELARKARRTRIRQGQDLEDVNDGSMSPQNQQVSSIGPVAGPSGSGPRGQDTTDMPLHPSTSRLDLARPYDRNSYHSVHIEGPHDSREPTTEQMKTSEDVAGHTTRRERGLGAEGSRQAQGAEEPSVPPQSQPSTSAGSTAASSGSGLHGEGITDRTSSSYSSTSTRSNKAGQRPQDDRDPPHARSPEASSRHLSDLTSTPRAGPSLTRSVVWPARSPETSTRHLSDITNTPRAGPRLSRSVIWPSFPLPPYHGPHQYSFSGYGYPGAGYGTNLAPHHESSGMHQSSYYGYSSHYYPNFDHNRISGREWVDHGHSLDDDSTPSRSRRGTLEDASYSPTPRPDGHMPLPFHRESTAVSTVAYLPLSSDRSSNESHIHDRLAGRSEGIPTGQRTQPSIAAMPQSDGPIHLPVGVRGRRDTYTPLPSFSSLVSSVPSLEEPRLSGSLSVPESRPTIPSRSQVAAPALSEDIDPEIVAARTLMDIRRVHFGNLNGENASGSQTQSRAIGSSRRRRGPYDRPPTHEHRRDARPSRERPQSTRKRSSRR